jgi:hypothetical protein
VVHLAWMESELRQWEYALDPRRRDAALAVALEVARGTADPGHVEEAIAAAVKQTSGQGDWEAPTVAQGEHGLARSQ